MDLQRGGRITRSGGATGHEHELTDLTDVATDNVTSGQFLRYTTNMWVPENINSGDVTWDAPVGAQGANTSVQTTTAWGRTVMTLDITLTRPTLCLINFAAWLSLNGNATTGAGDIRCSVAGSGATTWSESPSTTSGTGPETYAYGQSLYATTLNQFDQYVATSHQRSGYQLRYLNAGTTTLTMKAYNLTTLPQASSVNYPAIHVIPLR